MLGRARMEAVSGAMLDMRQRWDLYRNAADNQAALVAKNTQTTEDAQKAVSQAADAPVAPTVPASAAAAGGAADAGAAGPLDADDEVPAAAAPKKAGAASSGGIPATAAFLAAEKARAKTAERAARSVLRGSPVAASAIIASEGAVPPPAGAPGGLREGGLDGVDEKF